MVSLSMILEKRMSNLPFPALKRLTRSTFLIMSLKAMTDRSHFRSYFSGFHRDGLLTISLRSPDNHRLEYL